MRVEVLAFARLRELLDSGRQRLDVPDGARVEDVWSALASRRPALEELRGSTRAARNGVVVAFDERLADDDELAFLPPVGGG